MDQLVHFYHNQCLFKCDKNMFNDVIKYVLTKLFLHDENIVDKTHTYIFELQNGVTKCIICSQLILTINMKQVESSILICSECCNKCVNNHIFIELYLRYYGEHGLRSYWFIFDNDAHRYIGASLIRNDTHFINNSHKLIHRFYHIVPIIFLMSPLDVNSYCHDLNLDVMLHILKFIY